MEQFDLDAIDDIISNAGGCGGHLKRYQHLLPDEPRAKLWDAKLKDIHEFLVCEGFETPTSSPSEIRKITCHESCHLRHGRGIADAPREILRAIRNLELIELSGSAECCGSAEIYNVHQPEESRVQLDKKLKNIARSGAETVATSNPGCHLQIATGLDQDGQPVEVSQPVILLAEAYRQ